MKSSSLLRVKREPEMVLAPVRGAERFFIKANVLFWCQKRTRKPPAISTRWIHEKGAARPFQTPKELSKPKNASRFAKRIFLCFSHLRLRRGCYVSAGRYVQQGRKVCCEAANRRRAKMRLRDLRANARISSIFAWSPLLRNC